MNYLKYILILGKITLPINSQNFSETRMSGCRVVISYNVHLLTVSKHEKLRSIPRWSAASERKHYKRFRPTFENGKRHHFWRKKFWEVEVCSLRSDNLSVWYIFSKKFQDDYYTTFSIDLMMSESLDFAHLNVKWVSFILTVLMRKRVKT